MKAVYGDRYSLKELKRMSDEKEIIFRRIYKGKIKPIKGFKKFLNDVKSRNILVGLASNAIRKNVSLIIKELEIYHDFDSIICGDEVDNGKPNPEMFNKTIDRFKINKNECLIFEDSIEGIKAANNSGINVIGITSSSSHKILLDAGSTINISNYVDFDLAKI
jgi:HAD superfamily hydrolase (TIGR01509 family)